MLTKLCSNEFFIVPTLTKNIQHSRVSNKFVMASPSSIAVARSGVLPESSSVSEAPEAETYLLHEIKRRNIAISYFLCFNTVLFSLLALSKLKRK